MSTPLNRSRKGGVTGATPAVLDGLTGLLLVVLSAASSTALPGDSTPAPNPPSAPGVICPTGATPTLVTAPAPTTTPARPKTPNPSVTTRPDGSTIQPVCALVPPIPIPAPKVAPEHTVGGAGLAANGVIVDASAAVPPPPEVTDVSYVVADMTTGEVLAAKSPHACLLPASTLKTLTALVVLPELDMAKKVTATDDEANAEGTRVGMVAGASYSVADLVNGMVLVSGNDTAYALADAYGGRDKTIAAMNAKAGELGAWDTVAVDPSGLDADGQHSSAYDLALLGRAVMRLPVYRATATTKEYTFPGGTDRAGKVYPSFQIQNHNTLLESYPGAIGVKNGYTTGARHTFIGAATRGGRTLIVAEMGGTVVPSWQPTAALLDWSFANADQLEPVGTLVAPGAAARPPELKGVPIPTTAGTPSPSATTAPEQLAALPSADSSTTDSSTPAPLAAPPAETLGPGGNPGPWLLTGAGVAARNPVTYAIVALLGLGVVSWAWRRRRHQP